MILFKQQCSGFSLTVRKQCCQLKSREKRIDKMNLKMRKYVKGEKLSKT